MKENIYDNPIFFKKYKNFPRSREGLKAAGEWHTLERMLPDFHHKRVLDIGCGFGWHCIYAIEHGAIDVTGIDISEKMLEVAKEKSSNLPITYQQVAMEDMDFPNNRFDVVLSSLAFHYTPDFDSICKKVSSYLSKNGSFIFSVEHPVFTAEGSQDWTYDKQGNSLHWPVDNYFIEGERNAIFLNESVTKYHRTLTTYINTLLAHGFTIENIVEPMPSEQLLKEVPEMKDELRRPMMLIISAKKK